MSSNIAAQDSEPHPPGSFPTDDMLLSQDSSLTSSKSHRTHNKLHKREDPRGWSDEEKAARGHQYTDSGIGLTDSNYAQTSRSQERTDNERAFQPNTTDIQSRGAAPNTTARSTDYRSNEDKPGVVTGAYSRDNIGSNDDHYPKSTTSNSNPNNQPSAQGIGAVGPATAISTAARSSNEEHERSSTNHNTIRNGIRQTSNVEHQDPYWGSVPYGTGIYNTVTGHGSSETPAEGSVHSHGLPLNNEHQRAFPLSTSNNKPREVSPRNGSRFKEGLDESSVAAGAGLAAPALSEKRDHQRETQSQEPAHGKHEDADVKKENKISSFFHRDHKDEKKVESEKKHDSNEIKLKDQTPSKDDRPLTDRDAGAALAAASMAYGAKGYADKHDKKPKESKSEPKEDNAAALYQHPNKKVDSDDPFIAAGYKVPSTQNTTNNNNANNTHPTSEDVTTRGHPFTAQPTDKGTDKGDSKLGYGLAAAGVGTGAAYAAHEHASQNRNRSDLHSTEPLHNSSATGTPNTTSQSAGSGYTIGKPQLGVIIGNTETTGSPEKTQYSPLTGSNVDRSYADPSHHGEYNVLSGGTPSGINTGKHYGDKKDLTPSSPSTTRSAVSTEDHTGTKAAAAGAGVAAASAAPRYTGKRRSEKTSVSNPKEIHELHAEPRGAHGRTSSGSSQGGMYKTLSSGTPSGVNVDDGHDHNSHVTTSSPTAATRDATNNNSRNHNYGRTTAGATAAGATSVAGAGVAANHYHHQDAEHKHTTAGTSTAARGSQPGATAGSPGARTSTDSSHGGQYKVLPSGTPSGINVEGHGRDARPDHTASARGVHHPADTTVSAGATPETDAAAPAAAARTKANAAVMSGAAAGPAGLRAPEKVLHRCARCGEENDITGYFRR